MAFTTSLQLKRLDFCFFYSNKICKKNAEDEENRILYLTNTILNIYYSVN